METTPERRGGIDSARQLARAIIQSNGARWETERCSPDTAAFLAHQMLADHVIETQRQEVARLQSEVSCLMYSSKKPSDGDLDSLPCWSSTMRQFDSGLQGFVAGQPSSLRMSTIAAHETLPRRRTLNVPNFTELAMASLHDEHWRTPLHPDDARYAPWEASEVSEDSVPPTPPEYLSKGQLSPRRRALESLRATVRRQIQDAVVRAAPSVRDACTGPSEVESESVAGLFSCDTSGAQLPTPARTSPPAAPGGVNEWRRHTDLSTDKSVDTSPLAPPCPTPKALGEVRLPTTCPNTDVRADDDLHSCYSLSPPRSPNTSPGNHPVPVLVASPPAEARAVRPSPSSLRNLPRPSSTDSAFRQLRVSPKAARPAHTVAHPVLPYVARRSTDPVWEETPPRLPPPDKETPPLLTPFTSSNVDKHEQTEGTGSELRLATAQSYPLDTPAVGIHHARFRMQDATQQTVETESTSSTPPREGMSFARAGALEGIEGMQCAFRSGEYTTPDGRVYYYDAAKGKSKWVRSVPPRPSSSPPATTPSPRRKAPLDALGKKGSVVQLNIIIS